jgi:hypothetical protein
MAALEADQVSQPGGKAALKRFAQVISVISDSNIPGTAAALDVAPRHQLKLVVEMFFSDEDPAAIEAFVFKKFLGIACVNANLYAAQEAATKISILWRRGTFICAQLL